MKLEFKQVLGIDVAQDELVTCFGKITDQWKTLLVGHKTFANTKTGFQEMIKWVKVLSEDPGDINFVMEATGVYHEKLAYFLHEHSFEVSIVLPNKISNYARSLTIKTVTDKTASEAIMQFGLERTLDTWAPPKGIYKKLQQLTRERGQIVDERTVVKNQLHAENAEAKPYKPSITRAKKRIELLKMQEIEITEELKELIKTDEEVRSIIVLLCTVPGIGLLTATTILGETNGFDLIRNKRQLTSYAGLDVKEKQSGTSVKGKPRISKKGNRFLRKAMHMPALTAIRHNERYKAVFARAMAKHGIKMKGVVIVQRKLLEMAYTIYKKRESFDKEYLVQLEEILQPV